MKRDERPSEEDSASLSGSIYDYGTLRVVAFACLIIILAVGVMGTASFLITRDTLVERVKSRDLPLTLDAISANLEARIGRAKETVRSFAHDPLLYDYILSEGTDAQLGGYVAQRLDVLAHDYDYGNSFVVNALTRQIEAKGMFVAQNPTEGDSGEGWVAKAIAGDREWNVDTEFDVARKGQFIFVVTLIGDRKQPVGVAGLGINLAEIEGEFRAYRLGPNERFWFVNEKGFVYLSNLMERSGKELSESIPDAVAAQIVKDPCLDGKTHSFAYQGSNGRTLDVAYRNIESTGWKLIYQVPRADTMTALETIRSYSFAAGLIVLLLLVFVFYFVAYRIANPLKRATRLSKEMEQQVAARTFELAEKNREIMDSIDYAKFLQESMLPAPNEKRSIFTEYFVYWRPRDLVGGDFYWIRRKGHSRYIVLADCTGHGVPGAFMTMALNGAITHIVDSEDLDPASLIAELNRQMKALLHRRSLGRVTDDGLDIAVCRLDNNRLTFAGAKLPLFICRGGEAQMIRGDRKNIGYRSSPDDLQFENHVWELERGDVFYLTTDGYVDQNGGEKDYAFGRSRFMELIAAQDGVPLEQQREAFEAALAAYMGEKVQRDDITLIGFTFG